MNLANAKATLELAGARIETLPPEWRSQLLGVLSNAAMALALLMIGIYGLFVEYTNPGFGVPGVAGAISLLLALYALHLLPVTGSAWRRCCAGRGADDRRGLHAELRRARCRRDHRLRSPAS